MPVCMYGTYMIEKTSSFQLNSMVVLHNPTGIICAVATVIPHGPHLIERFPIKYAQFAWIGGLGLTWNPPICLELCSCSMWNTSILTMAIHGT